MNFLNPLIVPEDDPDYPLIARFNTFYTVENQINDNQPLHLFTWCPAEDQLPDCDFESQHAYFANLVVSYLKACQVGLACVETTQRGNPHYHGWYQTNPSTEKERIVMVKIMQRFGIMKITDSVGHYKKGSFSNVANCLWYYKKDALDAMLHITMNPLHALSDIVIDHDQYKFFFYSKNKRKSIADLEDKVSLAKFYHDFYTKSIN